MVKFPDEVRNMRLLIIDDEPVNVSLLQGILGEAGFYQVCGVTDPREGIEAFRDWRPDIVLLDLMMPYIDGYEVLKQIREETGDEAFLPVMVLTADVTESAKRRALEAGATDFLFKPINNTECLLRISNILTTRRLHLQLAAHKAGLEERVRERTLALETALAELRSAQRQIVQRERLSALGSMVTGVAHDFNNSLAIILAHGEQLQRECRTLNLKGKISDCAQTIIMAAVDAGEMIGRLREFQRTSKSTDSYVPVHLDRIVDQVVELTRPRWEAESHGRGAPISCKCLLGNPLPISGNAAELREMVTNLVFNSIEAMSQGGTIYLTTSMRAGRIVLEVRDEGRGMTEDVKRRCLEPFFTTKNERSAGLGLSSVYGIVQRHAGTIQVQSRPGWGSAFILTFPADVSGVTPKELAKNEPRGAMRILVVDDQEVLTEILAEMLRREWHTVTTATNGADALEAFRDGDFDLVITDKAMPEMNGDQLAAAIKARSPEIPVLMLTGFGDASDLDEAVSEFVDEILVKPATTAAIREAIARVLDRKGRG